MEVGKAYLIHCGDWHTFVGRIVRQTGPFTYVMTSCSKLDTRDGDVWHLLAAGDKRRRKNAEYWHDKTERLVVLSITALEWIGETPQEAGLEGH